MLFSNIIGLLPVHKGRILADGIANAGQELTLLPRVFDRMCFFTDAATLTLLQEKLTAAYPDLDTQLRVVPFVPAKRDAGCWIVTT